VLVVVGGGGVSGSAYPAEQVPYVISGGVGGVFLLGLGAMLWLSADLRDEWRKLDRIEQAVRERGVLHVEWRPAGFEAPTGQEVFGPFQAGASRAVYEYPMGPPVGSPEQIPPEPAEDEPAGSEGSGALRSVPASPSARRTRASRADRSADGQRRGSGSVTARIERDTPGIPGGEG
jgi:hypothetical protein